MKDYKSIEHIKNNIRPFLEAGCEASYDHGYDEGYQAGCESKLERVENEETISDIYLKGFENGLELGKTEIEYKIFDYLEEIANEKKWR